MTYVAGSRSHPVEPQFPDYLAPGYEWGYAFRRWNTGGGWSPIYTVHDPAADETVGVLRLRPEPSSGYRAWFVEDQVDVTDESRRDVHRAMLTVGPWILSRSVHSLERMIRKGSMDRDAQRAARLAGWYPQYEDGSDEVIGFSTIRPRNAHSIEPMPWNVSLQSAVRRDPGRADLQIDQHQSIVQIRNPQVPGQVLDSVSIDAVRGAIRRSLYLGLARHCAISSSLIDIGADYGREGSLSDDIVHRLRRYTSFLEIDVSLRPALQFLAEREGRDEALGFLEVEQRVHEDVRAMVAIVDHEVRALVTDVREGRILPFNDVADVQRHLLRADNRVDAGLVGPPFTVLDLAHVPIREPEVSDFNELQDGLIGVDADPPAWRTRGISSVAFLRSAVIMLIGKELVLRHFGADFSEDPERSKALLDSVFRPFNASASLRNVTRSTSSPTATPWRKMRAPRAHWRRQMYPKDLTSDSCRGGFGRINVRDGRQLWDLSTEHTFEPKHKVHRANTRFAQTVLVDPTRKRQLALLLETGVREDIVHMTHDEAVREAGEFGPLAIWAHQQGVPVFGPDPPFVDQLRFLWGEVGNASTVVLAGRVLLQYLESEDLNCIEEPEQLEAFKVYLGRRAKKLPLEFRHLWTYENLAQCASRELHVDFDPCNLDHVTMLWSHCNWQTQSVHPEAPVMELLREFRDRHAIAETQRLFETYDIVKVYGHPHEMPFELAHTQRYAGPEWGTVRLWPEQTAGELTVVRSDFAFVRQLDEQAFASAGFHLDVGDGFLER